MCGGVLVKCISLVPPTGANNVIKCVLKVYWTTQLLEKETSNLILTYSLAAVPRLDVSNIVVHSVSEGSVQLSGQADLLPESLENRNVRNSAKSTAQKSQRTNLVMASTAPLIISLIFIDCDLTEAQTSANLSRRTVISVI